MAFLKISFREKKFKTPSLILSISAHYSLVGNASLYILNISSNVYEEFLTILIFNYSIISIDI